MSKKSLIVGQSGAACPRCGRPSEIHKHREINRKILRQPYYYSQWFVCRNKECKTTVFMRDEFRVENNNKKNEWARVQREAESLHSEFVRKINEEETPEDPETMSPSRKIVITGAGAVVNWGKHKGKTYDWVAQEERDYFDWAIKQEWLYEYRCRHILENIRVALARNPKQVYVPEVLTGERKEAMAELDDWRTGGLDYLKKQNELRKNKTLHREETDI